MVKEKSDIFFHNIQKFFNFHITKFNLSEISFLNEGNE